MAEWTGSFPTSGIPREKKRVLSQIFFGIFSYSNDPNNIQPGDSQGNQGDGNFPMQSNNEQIVMSSDYRDGIRYGLHRLEQLIDHFTVINGRELYPAYLTYISTMREVGGENWTPAYWDGIFEAVIHVKAFEESDVRPKDILKEIKSHFKQFSENSIHNTLTDEQRIKRRTLIGMLASNFHPDAFFVKTLSIEEQLEREEIFKNHISPAIANDSILGYAKLLKVARDFGIIFDES